jgi:hypothetical protein
MRFTAGPGQKPPFLAVKRPARPYKSAIETDLLWETLRPLKRPGRARTVAAPVHPGDAKRLVAAAARNASGCAQAGAGSAAANDGATATTGRCPPYFLIQSAASAALTRTHWPTPLPPPPASLAGCAGTKRSTSSLSAPAPAAPESWRIRLTSAAFGSGASYALSTAAAVAPSRGR